MGSEMCIRDSALILVEKPPRERPSALRSAPPFRRRRNDAHARWSYQSSAMSCRPSRCRRAPPASHPRCHCQPSAVTASAPATKYRDLRAVTAFAQASNGGLIGSSPWRPDTDCQRCTPPVSSSPPADRSPTGLMGSNRTGKRSATWIASSRARSQQTCRYRGRPRRDGAQPQDGESARPHRPAHAPRPR